MDNYYGFPATYQPAYQPNLYYQPTTTTPVYQPKLQQQQYQTAVPQYQQNQNMQPMNNSMIWVQGEAGAKAFVLPNNTTLPLWDSEAQVIYIKSVDANGKPTMAILDYTERNDDKLVGQSPKEEVPQIEYATKEQVDSINKQFDLINEKLNVLGSYVTKEQFSSLSGHIDELSTQVEDIENRITSFGKPQQNNNSNNRRGNK